MAIFPSTLPRPLAAGYGISPVDQVVRTEMESGASKARRSSYAKHDKTKVGWLLTAAQMVEFRAWFDSAAGANGGQAWFAISLDTGGVFETVDARFSGVFQADYVIPYWSVTATLEVI